MNNLKDMILTGPTGDRIFGLARAAFYGSLTYAIGKEMGFDYISIPFLTAGSLLTLDGLADLVSGEHQYLPEKVRRYFENRRQKQKNAN